MSKEILASAFSNNQVEYIPLMENRDGKTITEVSTSVKTEKDRLTYTENKISRLNLLSGTLCGLSYNSITPVWD